MTSIVCSVTYDLLRELQLTTFFGNPGSTEETFLKDFPDDVTYHLELQEASAIAIADGYAQATGRPAIVNVPTAARLGNAMGNLITASLNKTPLIVTAGQKTREMLLMEPWLTDVDSTQLPRPWVKWSCKPARAEDAPAAFMRACATALQPPAGPVFLSLPLDDWVKPCAAPPRRCADRQPPHRAGHRPARGLRRNSLQSLVARIDLRRGDRSPPRLAGGDCAAGKARRRRLGCAGERDTGRNRPVIVVIGDGSF